MAATDAANVNELQAPELRGVRRRRGVVDPPLTYLDAAGAREPSRGAKYLISDAQHPRPPQCNHQVCLPRYALRRCQPPRVHVIGSQVRTLARSCCWPPVKMGARMLPRNYYQPARALLLHLSAATCRLPTHHPGPTSTPPHPATTGESL